MLKVLHDNDAARALRKRHRSRGGAAPAAVWSQRFLADARTVAVPLNALHIMPLLHRSLARVERLARCVPNHREWQRIAIIVQLLVCTANERIGDDDARAALERLQRFINENDDLLDFTSWVTA